MADIVKVNTAALKEKSGEFKTAARLLQKDFDEFQRIVDHTRYYWVGPAADRYRKSFAANKAATDILLRRLEKYPEDLMVMAGLYEQNESKQTSTASALKTNYI